MRPATASGEDSRNGPGGQPGSAPPSRRRGSTPSDRTVRRPEVPVPDRPFSRTAVLITAGGLGIAATTALEVVTAPYSPLVTAYPINGVVHVVKVLAAIVFVAGMLGWSAALRRRGERVAGLAAGVLAGATLAGAVPYSVVEATLSPGLSPAAADARLNEVYDEQVWIGTVASIALVLILVTLVTLAVVVLRHRLLPAWAPAVTLAAIPVAVLAGVLGGAGWAVPHPPTWIFLGLAAYGPALARRALSHHRVAAAV
jgi:hypothetical protein